MVLIINTIEFSGKHDRLYVKVDPLTLILLDQSPLPRGFLPLSQPVLACVLHTLLVQRIEGSSDECMWRHIVVFSDCSQLLAIGNINDAVLFCKLCRSFSQRQSNLCIDGLRLDGLFLDFSNNLPLDNQLLVFGV